MKKKIDVKSVKDELFYIFVHGHDAKDKFDADVKLKIGEKDYSVQVAFSNNYTSKKDAIKSIKDLQAALDETLVLLGENLLWR